MTNGATEQKRTSKTQPSDLSMMPDASVDCLKLINQKGELLRMNRADCLALDGAPARVGAGVKWLSLLLVDVCAAGRRALHAAWEGWHASFGGCNERLERDVTSRFYDVRAGQCADRLRDGRSRGMGGDGLGDGMLCS